MGRRRRERIGQDYGSYHVVSRFVPEAEWLSDGEKEAVLQLLERLARGYFVQIHAFCLMSNHFHLLVTGQEREAGRASRKELWRRYRAIYGRRADPPAGSLQVDGSIDDDPDGGVARLRERLGDVSRFVQAFKQGIVRLYNNARGRTGALFQDRFKAVVTEKGGDAEITQAAYIDLNPIRAEIVRIPEDYRWSSAGLKVRSPRRAKRLLTPLDHPELQRIGERWYRQFVYCAGVQQPKGKPVTVGRISAADAHAIIARQGALGILQRLRYRCRNLSEGVAVGGAEFVASVQHRHGRKHLRGRPFLQGDGREPPSPSLCGTRVLRDAPA